MTQPVAARSLAVRQATDTQTMAKVLYKPSEAIALLQTWLAPIDIKLPGGGTEPFEPALIGPVERKYLRRILDTMIELEAKTHGR